MEKNAWTASPFHLLFYFQPIHLHICNKKLHMSLPLTTTAKYADFGEDISSKK